MTDKTGFTYFDRFCIRMAAWFAFLMWLIWFLEGLRS